MEEREFKFRRRYFRYDGTFSHFSYWGPETGTNNFCGPSSCNYAVGRGDEQFTGLHDKNGKEIYEGDELKPSRVGRDSGRFIVRYDVEIAAFHCSNEKMVYIDASNWGNREVIGNIHETSPRVGD